MTRLIIGLPTRGNDISSELLRFILTLLSNKCGISVNVIIGQSSVSAAYSVEKVWEMLVSQLGQFDYYLQLDTDVIPPQGAVESMISRDKDIVVAPIWHYDAISKDIHLNIHPKHLRERQYKLRDGGCERIYASSLGCVLMKSKVIETFVKVDESPIKWSKMLGEYTGSDIHNDNIFFAKADKLGLETWIDWDVKNVRHMRGIELSTEVLGKFLSTINELNRLDKEG